MIKTTREKKSLSGFGKETSGSGIDINSSGRIGLRTPEGGFCAVKVSGTGVAMLALPFSFVRVYVCSFKLSH